MYPSPVNDAKAADRAQILRNSEPLGGGRGTDHYHARAWEAVLGVGPLTLSCPRGRFHRREKEGPVSSSEWFDHTVTANSARGKRRKRPLGSPATDPCATRAGQASPIASPSRSAWSALGRCGQLSKGSGAGMRPEGQRELVACGQRSRSLPCASNEAHTVVANVDRGDGR